MRVIRGGVGFPTSYHGNRFCRERFPWVHVGSSSFTIPKNGSSRHLAFGERAVLHHAVMNVCKPVLDSWLIDDTFACRFGKGLTSQHFANFDLGWFDRVVKEPWRIRGYLRYRDDMLLWSDFNAALRSVLQQTCEHPTRTLARVYAAIAYCEDHREEIECAVEDEARTIEEFRREHPKLVRDCTSQQD